MRLKSCKGVPALVAFLAPVYGLLLVLASSLSFSRKGVGMRFPLHPTISAPYGTPARCTISLTVFCRYSISLPRSMVDINSLSIPFDPAAIKHDYHVVPLVQSFQQFPDLTSSTNNSG